MSHSETPIGETKKRIDFKEKLRNTSSTSNLQLGGKDQEKDILVQKKPSTDDLADGIIL